MPESAPQPQPQPQPPAAPKAPPAAPPAAISFQEFKRVELLVGKILEAREHPKADKLLLLKVDIGRGEPRQLVAGIRGHYPLEQLVGRQVAVVANLESAVIRGEKSEGMVLAAASGDAPVLLGVDRPVPDGSTIR